MIAAIDQEQTSLAGASDVTEINYYDLDQVDAKEILDGLHSMIGAASAAAESSGNTVDKYNKVLAEPAVMSSLIAVSRLPVFSRSSPWHSKTIWNF
jgi:hypothetical protein